MGSVNSVCPYPWTSLYLQYDGEIAPCCFHYPFANIRDGESLQEVWNGKDIMNLRRRWVTGDLKGTHCENCPGMAMFKGYDYPIRHIGELPIGRYSENALINLEEYKDRAILLQSKPVEVLYVPSTLCNIDCIHCCQPRYDKTPKTVMATDLILEFYHTFGFMAVRHLLSGGEPLALGDTYELLRQMPQEQKEASELMVLTNGLLIKKAWPKLGGFSHYGFGISVASLRQQVYERIHRGARLSTLLDNLEFLGTIKQGNKVKITRIMALMKSNFLDLADIVPSAKKYGFDETWIFPTHPSYGKRDLLANENIFGLPHLLFANSEWRLPLDHALLETSQAGMQPTLNHLEYADSLLPKSKGKARIVSVRTLASWPFRAAAFAISQSPKVRRFFRRAYVRVVGGS